MKPTWQQHNGIKYLYCDYRDVPPEEFEKAMKETEAIICAQPPNSVLEITDLRGLAMMYGIVDVLKKSSARKKPYIKAEAAVITGIRGPKKVLLEAVSRVSGMPISVFETLEDAQEWTVKR